MDRQLCQRHFSGTGSFSRKRRQNHFRIGFPPTPEKPSPGTPSGIFSPFKPFPSFSSPSTSLYFFFCSPFPQVNSFLCTLIGSSGSNLLCLFRNFLLIFLSSLLIPNLVALLFIPYFPMFPIPSPQAISYILGTHHTEVEPNKESHSHYN